MGGRNGESEAAEAKGGTTSAAATEEETPARPGKGATGDRAGLIAGGAVLAACAALVLYGVLGTGGSGPAHHSAPTAPVTYEVTGAGTADLSYQARSASGRATVVHAAHLPWHTTVDVPLGQEPIISIVLGAEGGRARCSLAVHGRHVTSSTATGSFGRATCSGVLPSPDASAG